MAAGIPHASNNLFDNARRGAYRTGMNKSKQIAFRLEPEQRAAMEAAAKAADRTLSAMVRHIVVAFLNTVPAPRAS